MDIVDENELEISAEEAQLIATKVLQDLYKKELKEIFREIRRAARTGDFVVFFNHWFSDETVVYLRKLGYKVEEKTYYSENETQISWEEVEVPA